MIGVVDAQAARQALVGDRLRCPSYAGMLWPVINVLTRGRLLAPTFSP